jgi:hypothetical protein
MFKFGMHGTVPVILTRSFKKYDHRQSSEVYKSKIS